MPSLDSLKCRRSLEVAGKTYHYYSLPDAAAQLGDISRLPTSLKVLLENLLRWEDDVTVRSDDLRSLVSWLQTRSSDQEIQYRPARVLMQDFTGVPAVVDLAAMRDAVARAGGDPQKINPLTPVDLVIDHSVMVDRFGSDQAFEQNVEIEMQRNGERYEFLRWGQQAFDNFSVVPPGTGICHQVNLEYLGQVVWTREENGETVAYPDTLVGTDSHTTMINGLGVLGWGVGGIEAEAAMLGQPVSMLIPEVIGFRLSGKLNEGVTATDLVLTVTQMLRKHGVVGKFVEFYGPGLDHLPLADRATIGNMAPEYGATCGFFPVDQITIDYLRLTGRNEERIALVEAYSKAQGMWRDSDSPDPVFTATLELDLAQVQPSVAGPKRPQDRVTLGDIGANFDLLLETGGRKQQADTSVEVKGENFHLKHGAVVIAAITSCTNTSNPNVLMAAGLVAKKAVERGLKRQPWVKSSLAPGSKVVTDYLERAGLTRYLDQLGFNLVGYGCTTCIGNSGPLPAAIGQAITDNDLIVSSVLSGNRNFEGRVHPLVKANWLASPPLVVAFALAGTTRINMDREPLGYDDQNQPVYLKDIWPSSAEIAEAVARIDGEMFRSRYADVFSGDEHWQKIPVSAGDTYQWNASSSYVQNPPYFEDIGQPPTPPADVENARVLAVFGDSITTDHISPAGNIKASSPAGLYLQSLGVAPEDFNSYGSRRGNHEVMMRGTFANIRIKNEMLGGEEGGNTLYQPSGEKLSIYDAAMRYQAEGVPLVVIAGKEYGTGSSRDWAAKGTNLLGVKAVIAESFERIHRSNLIGMGVLALQFVGEQTRQSLGLNGTEKLSIRGLGADIKPRQLLTVDVERRDGSRDSFQVLSRIDTLNEVQYFKAGGILHYVLRQLIGS
ncbi:aconitate hydratase AcnA [Pseudomonas sp. WS 5018]|uniref:Aconitate hydratase n=1 Tax=Stutzerimonas stutzeri TaxID=316 RepID=A0A4S2BJ85_STUST|nr:aconitate hydratase AcnA [Stutzerimonas stutzeri]NMY62693.1 aconitate hydratase AcnA [Pseudomonas sp. WS 5018]AEA83769.1 aconitate hydratase 1 [Stutzerimonas stutzeri DSM 4166]MDH0148546.1 aconitate hydratase AcnA [Stutzerimonas stutzeri]MDH0150569.1 aconitate hydratase AcnA [Stutzerimonas stutzeri]MDH0608422.1 aconitate hydratase AcnA [Stutzerimonas stutzeri]